MYHSETERPFLLAIFFSSLFFICFVIDFVIGSDSPPIQTNLLLLGLGQLVVCSFLCVMWAPSFVRQPGKFVWLIWVSTLFLAVGLVIFFGLLAITPAPANTATATSSSNCSDASLDQCGAYVAPIFNSVGNFLARIFQAISCMLFLFLYAVLEATFGAARIKKLNAEDYYYNQTFE